MTKRTIQIFCLLAVVMFVLFVCYNYFLCSESNIETDIETGHIAEVDIFSTARTINNHSNATRHVLPHSPISKDLVAHSAYFDDRARNGHNNITVIFIAVKKTILDSGWILGCGVSNIEATDFLVFSPKENFDMHVWKGKNAFVHETVMVMCYDLPVKDGMTTFVIYKTSNKSDKNIWVESENPLVIPAPRVQPTGTNDITVVTCTKVHDKGVTWFLEFVRYQKTIGVDHVHISILDAFIKDGGLDDNLADPFLAKAIEDGYVSFSVWKEWYGEEKEVFLHSEIIRKLDCIYRFRGTYDYAFPVDTDDFFTPRIPGNTDLQYYIRKYCYTKPAASCTFQWLFKYPACGLDGEVGPDGNITKHLKSQKSDKFFKGKSVHSTKALVDATFHNAKCKDCLLPGYKAVDVPGHVAYVAHIRLNQDVKNKC